MSIDLRLGELERQVRWLASRSERALEAVFVNTASSPASSLRVTVPGYDDGEHTFGPVVWSPLGNTFPQAGDRALVAESDDGSWWVLAWWSSGQATVATVPETSARVFNSLDLDTLTGALTTLTFDSEIFDNGDLHSTTVNTSRLTAPATGLYMVGANIRWVANATGYRQLRLVNSTGVVIAFDARAAAPAGQETNMAVQTLWRFVAGEYVTVVAAQSSGGNLKVERAASYSPEFWMRRQA